MPGKRKKSFKIQVVTRRTLFLQETKDTVLALFSPVWLPPDSGWNLLSRGEKRKCLKLG